MARYEKPQRNTYDESLKPIRAEAKEIVQKMPLCWNNPAKFTYCLSELEKLAKDYVDINKYKWLIFQNENDLEDKYYLLPFTHRFCLHYIKKHRARFYRAQKRMRHRRAYLITLTINPALFKNLSMYDCLAEIHHNLNSMLTVLRKSFRFKYVWFFELGKENYQPHIHLLLFTSRRIDYKKLHEYWHLGNVHAMVVKEGILYITKYLLKLQSMILNKTYNSLAFSTYVILWACNRRSYSTSRDFFCFLKEKNGAEEKEGIFVFIGVGSLDWETETTYSFLIYSEKRVLTVEKSAIEWLRLA